MNETPFMLPVGLLLSDGQIHRSGSLRPATALDEIEPIGDDRVRRNEAYYGLLLLSRVVTRLGPYSPVPPEVIAALPAADYAYLQSLYASVNAQGFSGVFAASVPAVPGADAGWTASQAAPARVSSVVETECPHCGALLELNLEDADE